MKITLNGTDDIREVEKIPPETTIMKESFVGQWFFFMELICFLTIIFSLCGLAVSVLDEYNATGTKIMGGLSFERFQAERLTGLVFIFPILFSLFFWLSYKAENFGEERSNKAPNFNGRVTRKINGKKVRRIVFKDLTLPFFFTFIISICFIGSFSVFYSVAIPRCEPENQKENEGWWSVPAKLVVCSLISNEAIRAIIATIPAILSLVLWNRFYYSMPLPTREQAIKKGKKTLATAANMQHHAANKLQSVARGKKVKNAAIKLQSVARGKKVKNVANKKAQQNAAQQSNSRSLTLAEAMTGSPPGASMKLLPLDQTQQKTQQKTKLQTQQKTKLQTQRQQNIKRSRPRLSPTPPATPPFRIRG